MAISGGSDFTDAFEDVHGLPRGTIEAMGPETAAQMAVWIQQGYAEVTPEGKFRWLDPPSLLDAKGPVRFVWYDEG